jgi:glycosyltransferase involved in cell wall biosynthesis
MTLLTFVIPALNEEETIGKVIEQIPYAELKNLGFQVEVLVVDDGSKDNTANIAASKGAFLIQHEENKGKGTALYTAFKSLSPEVEYVVMLDADCTYNPKESLRLIKLLMKDSCDIVIGSRLNGKMEKNALSSLNFLGNLLFTFLVKSAYRVNVTDCCSGFVAWKRKVIDNLMKYCKSDGFSIEMEMLTKARKLNYNITSIPISYYKRGGGEAKLHPIKDGYKILYTLFKNLSWKPEKLN